MSLDEMERLRETLAAKYKAGGVETATAQPTIEPVAPPAPELEPNFNLAPHIFNAEGYLDHAKLELDQGISADLKMALALLKKAGTSLQQAKAAKPTATDTVEEIRQLDTVFQNLSDNYEAVAQAQTAYKAGEAAMGRGTGTPEPEPDITTREGFEKKFGRRPRKVTEARRPSPAIETIPASVESKKFTGRPEVLKKLRVQLTEFGDHLKKQVGSMGLGEDVLQKVVGERMFTLINGDVDEYVAMVNEGRGAAGDPEFMKAFKSNSREFRDHILETGRVDVPKLKAVLGEAFDDLGFDDIAEAKMETGAKPAILEPSSTPKSPKKGFLGRVFERKKKDEPVRWVPPRQPTDEAVARERERVAEARRAEQDRRDQEAREVKEALEKAKFDVDPLVSFLRYHKVDVKFGDITYGSVPLEDVGKESASLVRFSNYSDYRTHLDTMPLYRRYRSTTYSMSGPLATEEFRKFKEKFSPDDLEKYYGMNDYTRLGYAGVHSDSNPDLNISGPAEIRTEKDCDQLVAQARLQGSYMVSYVRDPNTRYYILEKMISLAKVLNLDQLHSFDFMAATKNEVTNRGVINFDPDQNTDEAAVEIKKHIPQATELGNKLLAAESIMHGIRRDLGNRVYCSLGHQLSSEESLQGAKSLEEAMKDINFSTANDLHIRVGLETVESDTSITLPFGMSSSEMRSAIESFLKKSEVK